MMHNIKSLYIHIPFCDHICSYCDFNKIVCHDEIKEKYINALIKEIEFKKEYFLELETIYIGGGTPSCLDFSFLNLIFTTLEKYIDLAILKEFTFECNPADITDSNIKEWLYLFDRFNISRISLGIQSFRNSKLKEMRRNHDKKQAIKALKLLYDNHFENVNCDLIYGFSKDNFINIKKDIKLAYKNHVKHISYYSLILEENTILYHDYQKGLFKEMNDDKEGILYNKIYKYLNKIGFKRYEISNFSLPGYESIHNLNVWNNDHYLACGVSGSYYIDNIRYTNIEKITDYINFINNDDFESIIGEKNILSIKDQMDEEILLGLRKDQGIKISSFNKKYNCDIFNIYHNIDTLIKQNILINKDDYLYIKSDKIYLENAVLSKIL